MADSIRLGRILGIPIGLHWGALLVAALFTLDLAFNALPALAPEASQELRIGAGVVGVVLFFASILAHELGHAVVALRHGIGVNGVTLWLMGGVARLDRHAPTARAELQVAVAGPVTSLALAVLFAAMAVIVNGVTSAPATVAVLTWLALINGVLAVFNLLPGAPLDGGRVLTALLWRRTGDANRARLIAGRCGLVLGAALVVAGVGLAFTATGPIGLFNAAVGLMIVFAASAEIRGAVIEERLTMPVHRLHLPHPRPIPDDTTLARFDDLTPSVDADLAHPVVRWGREPVGYIGPEAASVSGPARSWTTVAEVMHQPGDVLRVAADLPAGRLLEAWASAPVAIAVTVDDRGRDLGTVTERRLLPLLERPTRWGRDRNRSRWADTDPTPTPAAPVPVSARHRLPCRYRLRQPPPPPPVPGSAVPGSRRPPLG